MDCPSAICLEPTQSNRLALWLVVLIGAAQTNQEVFSDPAMGYLMTNFYEFVFLQLVS